ncbi:MAG: hypothetical protein COB83_01360 [Gammaproteobacteria bacterium]|nr:MAG: hypothetical protein COB83_01360 [Gammaproteobacteria bacterium]
MIAVLLMTALFVFISVYFFFRAEKLQHSIISLKRETAKSLKENQILSKSMVQMAANTEVFVKNRLQILHNKSQEQDVLDQLALIKPFINSYSLIFKECLMQKGKLHTITKQCFSNQESNLHQAFIEKIIKKDSKLQRLWNSNNFIGFISLTEVLLVKYERQSTTTDATKNESTEELSEC